MSGSTSTQSSEYKKMTTSSDRGRDHDQGPYKVLTVRDAIDMAIQERIVITKIIPTLIIAGSGMDTRPIGNCEPEARRGWTSSS
jgi:hypothetical protein